MAGVGMAWSAAFPCGTDHQLNARSALPPAHLAARFLLSIALYLEIVHLVNASNTVRSGRQASRERREFAVHQVTNGGSRHRVT
jgi:hypothetical protein